MWNDKNIWLKANKLTLNLDKSHSMIFLGGGGECKIDLDIPSLNHISLKKVKFLCIIIDDQLKLTNHILYT